jgi:hypothetical protein
MSQNSEEIPHKDRAKVSNLYPSIPSGERKECQQNYSVEQSGAERQGLGYGTGNFNVKKPNLKRGGENE